MKAGNNRRIYIDYASTTPTDKEVVKVMIPYFNSNFYNPSSLYKEAVAIKNVVSSSRKIIAEIINCRPQEIFFTASGTESCNMAILGIFKYFKNQKDFVPHIITSSIEHSAILEACRQVEQLGGEVTYIDPEKNGIVDVKKIQKSIKKNTVLISIMYANNEIGTIQPIKEIGRMIKLYKIDSKIEPNHFPFFHTDASQAPNNLSINREPLGVDMMTLDASKIYGPKGIGLLYKKTYVNLEPIIYGGGQEEGLRSGTENVPLIVGFSKALEICKSKLEKESKRLLDLRNYLIDGIYKSIPNSKLNGDKENRLPNNVNFCFEKINAEFAVILLDNLGIACSSASSCQNLDDDSSSYVIEKINPKCKSSSLRFTLGRESKKSDIDYLLKILPEVVEKSK
ncbi:cysteine desulfurase [Candidatus Nomurabacteria bacterium]|nr:cysteine desulfurase [Candidatus Nomurabacteria bacterium]